MDTLQFRAVLTHICSILACIVLVSQFCNIGTSAGDAPEGNHRTSGETASERWRSGEGSRGNVATTSTTSFLRPLGDSCTSPHCHGVKRVERPLMIVSTVDGKILALDINNAGQQQWAVDAGLGPLLSSSLSQFEISGPEGIYKVIPSLNGGLFRWDGETLEAVPFTAETLLSTSFKLSDDTVMVGGKELNTFGINARTGELQYICGSGGCQMYGDEASDDEDIIVVQRTRQTVRAVDQRNGSEKWNFSVGQHDVSLLEGARPSDTDDVQDGKEVKEGDVCRLDDDDEDEEEAGIIPTLMVDMTAKTVFALDGQNHMLWTHQLENCIANAWTISHGVVSQVDLFAPVTLGLTSDPSPQMTPFFSDHVSPILYIGNHKDQLYIQPSPEAVSEVSAAAWATVRGQAKPEDGSLIPPRVRWRPYAYTSVSRTPSLIAAKNEENVESAERARGHKASEVSVWNQYPFDNGYYLLHDLKPMELKPPRQRGITETNESEDAGLEILFSTSVWTWWREILSTSILIAIGMQLFLHCVLKPRRKRRRLEEREEERAGERSTEQESSTEATKHNDLPNAEYNSRYLTDFNHMECLGKGGFGIVFQAKNKIDENSYAVKRITLPNRKEAREKVLREARTLAILDHSGIVRYFNSWLEEPPHGWQESQDKVLVGESLTSNDLLSSVGTPALFNKNSELIRNREQLLQQTGGKTSAEPKWKNPASPMVKFNLSECDEETNTGDSEWGQVDQRGDGKEGLGVDSAIIFPGQVGGLSSGFDLGSDLDESGSFSIVFQGVEGSEHNSICSVSSEPFPGEKTPMNTSLLDHSASNQSTDTSANATVVVPFQQYGDSNTKQTKGLDRSDSFQIIFDDSGCSERPECSDNVSSEATPSDTSGSSLHSRTNGCADSGDEDRHSASRSRPEEGEAPSVHTSSQLATAGRPGGRAPRIYLYIQMQLCRKETLKDWLSTNTLSRDRNKVLHIFQQILEACSYIHGCGMIHRDLKPSNIFFSVDGKVKVGDFGLVTAIDTGIEDEEEEQGESSSGLKLHTGKVGTQLYMSPEQLAGQNYDHKVDIFSLGLIFFELFHPFSTQMERINVMCQTKKQQFPKRFTKELPLEAKFAKWLLSHNPDQRPDSEEINDSPVFEDLYEDYMPPSTHNSRKRGVSTSSR